MKRRRKKPADKYSKGSRSYLLVWNIQFTLLEEYIVKVLEGNGACSDEDIAEILCLDPEDVACIIKYPDGLSKNDRVQGDSSRRKLKSNFSRKEYAIAELKNGEAHARVGTPEDIEDEEELLEEYNCQEVPYKQVPRSLRKEGASRYYLMKGGNKGTRQNSQVPKDGGSDGGGTATP